jgi:phage terminase large subunit-like protein
VQGVWFDEEPPADIYFEGITRTNVSRGPVLLTFTPLMGMSAVVQRYLEEKFPGTHDTRMGIRDALHYSEADIEAIIASYPDHEREARTEGEPTLGSGAVFPVSDESISCTPFAIPDHWPRLAALDFGWDHPTACAWLAWDRDTDTIYIYDCHAARQTAVPVHAAAIKGRGEWIPVAWPHDGNNDTAIGANLASQYRDQGLNMLHEHAQFEAVTGSDSETRQSLISVEAGIQDMLTRMLTGRFKVFNHLQEWFGEKRLYRRENGKLLKLDDDRISATRYAVMMLRYAITKPTAQKDIRRQGGWRT